MRQAQHLMAACLLMTVAVVAGIGWAAHAWTPAQPGYAWSFPRDHWAREGYKTEWWYFTGHLRTVEEPLRRFGYQFTFFRIGLSQDTPRSGSAWAAKDLIMGHAALTHLDTGRHRFTELVVRAAPLLAGFGRHPDTRLAWSVGPPGTSEPWELRWNGNGFDLTMADAGKSFGFSLSTRPLKPVVFQGPGGLSRKGEGATEASHYYSFTRMATTGTVRLEGKALEVRRRELDGQGVRLQPARQGQEGVGLVQPAPWTTAARSCSICSAAATARQTTPAPPWWTPRERSVT